MPSYSAGMSVSSHALRTLSDAVVRHRHQRGSRWPRLQVGDQTLLVVAHLRKGETYTDLAAGFGIGTTWKVLRKICCCPRRATVLVKAALAFILAG